MHYAYSPSTAAGGAGTVQGVLPPPRRRNRTWNRQRNLGFGFAVDGGKKENGDDGEGVVVDVADVVAAVAGVAAVGTGGAADAADAVVAAAAARSEKIKISYGFLLRRGDDGRVLTSWYLWYCWYSSG